MVNLGGKSMFAKLATTAALLAVASPALAATVISNAPGPDVVPAGLTVIATFNQNDDMGGFVNGINTSVVTNTTTGSVINPQSGSVGGAAQPFPQSPANPFQAIQANGTSTFHFTKSLAKFSFYWGSIDTYNKLDFLRGDGTLVQTFTGADIINGNFGAQNLPASNQRVTFGFTGAEAVQKVRFSNNPQINAFEIDTLAIAAVPEPATWAMMILGFGLIGGAMRNRKSATTRLAYA